MNIICPICKRNTPEEYQEEHHLIPRQVSRRNKYAKIDVKETATVCYDCHDAIHDLLSNKELANKYNTIEMIISNEKVISWADWIAKKPISFGACHSSKKRKND